MDLALVVVLHVLFQPSLSVLFTVEAERTVYNSEFEGDVVMGCRFQPKPSHPNAELKVTWHWLTGSTVQEVYQWNNKAGNSSAASTEYLGRVKLLTEELQEGWAKLQVSRLRINDSGTYQCLVQTAEGADYKTITLSVIAPYKEVSKHIGKPAEGDKVLLTCQSEGYPNTSVVWQNGHLQTISPNTSAVKTPEQLFKVISQIYVSSSEKNNYTCHFNNEGPSATFHIPDELPPAHAKHDALIVLLSIGMVMAAIVIAVLIYRRRKGFSTTSTRNLLADSWGRSVSAARQQRNKENEEERTIFNEDHREEKLRAFLKRHYCDFQSSLDAEELRQRLQNNEGQPINIQALVPEVGETLFLGGPTGSGKTSIAYILVSSWTEGPTHALSSFLDLNILQLLLYIDCSTVKGDLFQEIMTQLSLKENISTEEELRTMLIRSSETLLLLDGYREGNRLFDESLKTFLSERGGCRVLVMTSQEHCPLLKETVGTVRELKLHKQIVKY